FRREAQIQDLVGQRAIERPGVQVEEAEPVGDRPRGGALAGPRRAVDGDDETHEAETAAWGSTLPPSSLRVATKPGNEVAIPPAPSMVIEPKARPASTASAMAIR